jgi:hypothetical protein
MYASPHYAQRAALRALRWLRSRSVPTNQIAIVQALASAPSHIKEKARLVRRNEEDELSRST